MRLPRGAIAISVVLIVALLAPALTQRDVRGTQATPAAVSGEKYTPIIQTVLTPPRWFTGSDGQSHLVYELLLTNAFPVPATVTTVDVLDADSGTPIAALAGDALAAVMSLLTAPGAATTELAPSTVGVVWLDLPFADAGSIPAGITHRVTVTIPPGLPVPETITFTGEPVTIDLRPPVVLGPPLVGPGWAAVGSCCDGPHRRAFQPIDGGLYLSQRFAIDFNRLDAEDRIVVGDPAVNESYPTYDQPVFAVADGTVVTAVDQYPDQVPNDPTDVTLASADGNHVVLDLGDGRFAFYAHLKPGSVAVRAGDRVRRGDPIGRTGNSGSSTGPHLHFHLMDAASPLAADGLPYVFDQFELVGRTPPLAEIVSLAETGGPVPIDRDGAGPRRDELPLGRDVVDFAGGAG